MKIIFEDIAFIYPTTLTILFCALMQISVHS